MNIILSYFEKNYKAVSEKLNVLIDEEMGELNYYLVRNSILLVMNVDIPKNLSLGLNIPITIAARLNQRFIKRKNYFYQKLQ